MSVLIVCPKSKGNTYEVCRYISNNSDVKLLIINQDEFDDIKKYESIILCSGVYGDKAHKNLLMWLDGLEKTALHEKAKLYMFLTWFGRGQSDKKAMKQVKSVLAKHEISIDEDYIACYGAKGLIRKSHPNKQDFEKVLNWLKMKTKRAED